MVVLEERSGVTKVTSIHSLGTMNIKPSKVVEIIQFKVVDRQTDITISRAKNALKSQVRRNISLLKVQQ